MTKKNAGPAVGKSSQMYEPCDKACDVLMYCYVKHISICIGLDLPLNKKMWEYSMAPDIKGWMNVIRECGENHVITKEDKTELRKLKELIDEFEKACEQNVAAFFWTFTYQHHLYYDTEHVGDLPNDRMWKTSLLSPSFVNKTIRAAKEPVIEIGKFCRGLHFNNEEVLEDADAILLQSDCDETQANVN